MSDILSGQERHDIMEAVRRELEEQQARDDAIDQFERDMEAKGYVKGPYGRWTKFGETIFGPTKEKKKGK